MHPGSTTPTEFLGRDWAHVVRAAEPAACLACGAATRSRICFRPRVPLAVCPPCRGYGP